MKLAFRLLSILLAAGCAAALLSGCVLIKPGTYSLSQPSGIGSVQLKFTACTVLFSEPEPGVPSVECGPSSEPEEGQMLLALVVPVGTVTPNSIPAVPSAGATATTFSRSPELAARLGEQEYSEGVKGAPAGFELVAYVSGVINETSSSELTWSMEAGLGLPPVADGGSYGGPFGANLILGFRSVTPTAPSNRPIDCKENEPKPGGQTYCGSITNESPLGVSDLKIRPPATTQVVPGAKVKLPFVLDLASSASEVPKFKLALTSALPGAELSLSNSSFTRAPTDPATKRAPATTRKAIVRVPTTAPLGSYELKLAATANKGGVASGAATLTVVPKGRAKATAPRKLAATRARSRGIPVKLYAPIAGTRFLAVVKGPKRLAKKTSVAKELGNSILRLRIPGAAADAALAAGRPLKLQVTARQPGLKKPLRLKARSIELR